MDIRLEQPEDFNAIHELVRVAFAVDCDEIVGHTMIDSCWVRSPSGNRPIVMLSPLAVAPDHQRCGIGTALIETAVAAADAAGETFIVLEGSPTYYGTRGFEFAGDHGLTLPLPGGAPKAAAQVRLLAAYDPTDPTLRGGVVYPAPFANLN